MPPFFSHLPAIDEHYIRLRDGAFPHLPEARDFIETIWPACEPFLDPDLPRHAAHSYGSRFWEVYLTHTLLVNHATLVPRDQRKFQRKGPDIQLSDSTWVEAVLATPGTGPDRVPSIDLDHITMVPDDQIKLRLVAAIEEKLRKAKDYLAEKVLAPTDRYVVAVSVRRAGNMTTDFDPPRIVRSVLPFGMPQVHISREIGEIVGHSFTHQPAIAKGSGAMVPTTLFQEHRSAPISAILFAAVDEMNRPDTPGLEFVTVHNPLAAVPLPRGYFAFGTEYWLDADALHCDSHHHPSL